MSSSLAAATFMLTNTKSSFTVNFLFVVTQIIYCFGEEFGWRNFLQNATNQTNKWLQSFIIGVVWFGWHFSWLEEPLKAMSGQNMPAPLPVLIFAFILTLSLISLLLGSVVNKTQAILLPTILHFVVKTNIPTTIITVVLIVLAVFTWNKFLVTSQIVDGETSP